MKQRFDDVVKENAVWLLNYVRKKVHNKDIAEDLVQEIWVKAFRAYDNYFDDGRQKPWLMRITLNHINNYFSFNKNNQFISLDYDSDEGNSIYSFLSMGDTPEEEYIKNELVNDILSVIGKLPKQKQQVLSYRFFDGLSVEETAKVMGIPSGTVKSKTYYTLDKIRKQLGYTKNEKGAIIMKCNETQKYLFMYAKGTLANDLLKVVSNHVSECEECRHIVSALKRLIPTMTFAREDEMSHFLINFPKVHITYCGASCEIPNYEELNKKLDICIGIIPENETWLTSGYSTCNTLMALFDNEGNEIEFEIYDKNSTHYRTRATKIKRLYEHMWLYQVFSDKDSPNTVIRSKEAPNLYYGSMHNLMGQPVKSALYQAIPEQAENIRIKRGNGVIDCGTYKFAYVDRYVTEDERISLDYSYLMNV